jgi:Beta-lactamase
LQIETAAVSSFSIAVDAIWRFAMRPKELRDCGQKDLFCTRLDQMSRFLDRHPVRIERLQPKITLSYCKTATSDAYLCLAEAAIWKSRLGSSDGLPMKIIQASCMAALTLCLAGVALADDLQTVGDSDSLGFSARRLERITSWFEAQSEKGDPSGFVVAIARGGKLVYLQPTGFENHDKKIPMRPDSIFRIGSMSKQITSVATMMLVDEGKLDLDAPVAQYLPELKDMPVVKTDPATGDAILLELEPAKRAMTIRDLLRNTSGLVYPMPDYADPGFGNAAIHALYGAKAPFRRDKPIAPSSRASAHSRFCTSRAKSSNIPRVSMFSAVSSKSYRERLSTSSCKAVSSRRCTWSTRASMCRRINLPALSRRHLRRDLRPGTSRSGKPSFPAAEESSPLSPTSCASARCCSTVANSMACVS